MQIVSKETICMKCQILFSDKNSKYMIHLSSAKFAQSRLILDKYFKFCVKPESFSPTASLKLAFNLNVCVL